MPKTTPIKRSFIAGEISPFVMGRTDSPAYENGAYELTNFMVRKHGAITRRPGSIWIGETKYSGAYPTRLHPFQWSTQDAYVLEFGGAYVRMWRDDTLVLGGNAKVIGNCVNSSGLVLVTTLEAHGFTTGNTVMIDGVTGTTEANGTWVVTLVNATQFTLDGSMFMNAFIAGGLASKDVLELPTPYTVDDLPDLSFAQSADVLWIAHPNHQTRTLTRYGNISWQFSVFETEDGPYLSGDAGKIVVPVVGTQSFAGIVRLNTAPNPFLSGNYVTVAGVTGTTEANGTWQNVTSSKDKVHLAGTTYANAYAGGGTVEYRPKFYIPHTTLTDEAIIFNAGTALTRNSTGTPVNGFVSGDVGRLIEVEYEGDWRLCKITAFIDAQRVKVNIFENYIGYLDQSIEASARARKISLAQAFNTGSRQNRYDRGITATSGLFTITTNYSIFNSDDVGKWLRPTILGGGTPTAENALHQPGTTSENWWKILRVDSGSVVGAADVDGSVAGKGTDYTDEVNYNGNTVQVNVVTRKRTCQIYSDVRFFYDTDIGRHIRFNIAGIWNWGKIIAVDALTNLVATVEYFGDIPTSVADPTKIAENGFIREIRLGAWSNTNGWPATVAFHGGRLIFGRTNREPQTMWMSVVEDYKNFQTTEFDGTVTDDLGITFTLASRQLNAISWILSQKILMVGTTGAEWQIRAATGISDAITASNIQAIQQSTVGSAIGDKAALAGNSLVFIQRESTRLMEMSYDWEVDSWQPTEMSAHAESMFQGPLRQVAYQSGQDSIVWVRDDNYVYGCTFSKAPAAVAFWAVVFELGAGVPRTSGIAGKFVHSMCVVNRNGIESLYVHVVDYYRDTSYIVKIPSPQSNYTSTYVDYALSKTAVGNVIGGLNPHFPDGTTVTIAELDQQVVVSGGQITIPGGLYGGTWRIGLPFLSRARALPIEGGSPTGTSHGKMKRAPKVDICTAFTTGYRVYELTIKDIGDNDVALGESITSSDPTLNAMDIRQFLLKSDYANDALLVFESIGAKPFTLCYFAPHQHVFE